MSLSITSPAVLPTHHVLLPLRPRATSNPAISTMTGFSDLKSCVTDCIAGYWGDFYKDVGCGSYACVCRADTFSAALGQVSSCISSGCDNTLDYMSATSLLGAYCSIDVKDAATTNDGKKSTTITISRTVITSDGAVVTTDIPTPMVTVLGVNNPQINNIINNGNGNGNSGGTGNGSGNAGMSLRIPSLWLGAVGLTSLLLTVVLM